MVIWFFVADLGVICETFALWGYMRNIEDFLLNNGGRVDDTGGICLDSGKEPNVITFDFKDRYIFGVGCAFSLLFVYHLQRRKRWRSSWKSGEETEMSGGDWR